MSHYMNFYTEWLFLNFYSHLVALLPMLYQLLSVLITINKILLHSFPVTVFDSRFVFAFLQMFPGEHPSQSVILIKLQRNFIEITLRHGCSPVNFLLFQNTFSQEHIWTVASVFTICNTFQTNIPSLHSLKNTRKTLFIEEV